MMITWFARKAAESESRRAIIPGLFVYDAIGFVVTMMAQLSGVLDPLGWSVAAVCLFFAIGFGYFLLPREKMA